ncbi:MAG: MotE family protein [Lachnospiraceae bacterium]
MAKKNKKNKNENGEGIGSRIVSAIFVILIIIVWLVILAALIKFDVGGFGSGVLRPVLKDVPVINKILPEPSEEELEEELEETDDDKIATLSQAKELIAQLKEDNETLTKDNKQLKEDVEDLTNEVSRLKEFEDEQTDFQKQKEEFYNEIVYGEKAPDADTYKEWYESIDSANAEAIYRQVISNNQADTELKNLAKTYENMKPAEAAAVLEKVANLDTVAEILSAMKAESRAKIMDEMDPDFAANVTKKLMP